MGPDVTATLYQFPSAKYYFPLHKLASPKKRLKELVDGLSGRVPVKEVQEAFIVKYGLPNLSELHLNSFFGLCALMPDLCTLYTSKHPAVPALIEPLAASAVMQPLKQKTSIHCNVPEDILYNLRRVTDRFCRIGLDDLEGKYKSIVGSPLDYRALGYSRLLDLQRDLDGKHGFKLTRGRLHSNCMVQLLPVRKGVKVENLSIDFIG